LKAIDGTQSESSKIHEFVKGLRSELAYPVNNIIGFREDETLTQVIDAARRIENNLQAHGGPAKQVHFTQATPALLTQTTETNDLLVEKLTVNLAKLLEPLAQALQQQNQNNRPYTPRNDYNRSRSPPICYRCNQPGHIATHCNNPPAQSTSNSRVSTANTERNSTRPRSDNNASNFTTTVDEMLSYSDCEYESLNF
jgi:hypothetical protein